MVQPDFKKSGGLVPAVVQDYDTKEVLMLAYMNELSWKKTLETGKATYWSRSRSELWVKGETSGNVQIGQGNPHRLRQRHDPAHGGAGRQGGLPHGIPLVLLPEGFRGQGGNRGRAHLQSEGRLQMKKLKLGIPKGSLETNTVDLFKRAGWRISYDSRSYFPDIDDEEISCSLVRAQEMSKYIEAGTLDLGLTGHDWVTENESDVVVVEDLVYSKVLARPARWVLVVREDSPVTKIEDLQGKKISTELVNFTKRYFKERNIDVKVEFSWGATEAKVVESLVDAIVEVTETGSTIKANRLRIVHELMSTNTQLIANKEAWDDPWKRRKIEQIRTMLKGSLLGMGKVVIKMNVSKENLGRVILLLPSLKAPTISNLYNEEWFAVETVVDSSIIRDLIPLLQEAGAEGIIEYALNKVV